MNTLTLKRFHKTWIKLEKKLHEKYVSLLKSGSLLSPLYYMYMYKALRKRLVIQTYIALRFADHYNRI